MSQTYLNENQKLEFLISGFHQYLIINLDTGGNIQGNMPTSFVNLTLRLEDIGGGSGTSAWGINKIAKYINETYDNILFTPASDFEKIYEYEYYKGVYYIKAKPFEETIVMHILPKGLRVTGKVLMFKDSTAVYNNISKSDYIAEPKRPESYFESIDLANNEAKEKRPITAKPYPKFHKFGSGNVKKIYKKHNGASWTGETYRDSFCEYQFDISKWAKNLPNVQINSGYSYNNSSAISSTSNDPYSIHYTGIKDNTNNQVEDRAVLIDANYDNVHNKTNNITQMEYYVESNNKKLRFPTSLLTFGSGFNNNHVSSSKIFHKTIKYFNDILYTEEDGSYIISEWDDPSI